MQRKPLPPVPPEKMRYLADVKPTLLAATEPAEYASHQHLVVEWLGRSLGRTRIRAVELVSDERAESTGDGRGVSPGHTFLAGLAFSHMTQWGRAAAACGAEIYALTEEVDASFDRRGEYLYDEGYAHPGFTEIRFTVRMESASDRETLRRFVSWADRSPPHATLRKATRLVGVYLVNGEHLATALYHADRTEWLDHP
ncbi:MAG: OsmC family protein [Chloroflexota bacterium]|nr:OsmC family protein [Chloroflexota bacterium]